MNKLTPRQQFILNELVDKGSLEVKSLYKQFDISNKTIYREIKAINKAINKFTVNVFNDSSDNIIISGKREGIEEIKKLAIKVPAQWILNKNQRQSIILLELLLSKEPLKVSYFKTKFNVAMASISFDLDAIEIGLKKRGLTLSRKKSYGIEVKGKSWNKRNAISDIFLDHKILDDNLRFFYEDILEDSYISLMFKVAFGDEKTKIIKEILRKLEIDLIKNNDIKNFEFFVQLLISIKSSENEETIIIPMDVVNRITSNKNFNKLEELNNILKEYNIQLPKEEIAYLNFYINNYKENYKDKETLSNININSIATEFIEEISREVDIDLSKDKQLINNLAQHFSESINILNLGLKITNPLLEEIKEHEEELFKKVSSVSKLIFSRHNIALPEDEIGYITLHLEVAIRKYEIELKKIKALIICPTGMSTAKMLSNRLSSTFEEIEVVDIGSVFDLKKMEEKNEFDVIISTFNLIKTIKGIKDKNIINVSPFLNRVDINNINEFIYKFKQEKESIKEEIRKEKDIADIKEETIIGENLLKRFTLKNIDILKFNDLINYIAEDIENMCITTNKEEIARLIFEREEKGNVVIPRSHVALIHTRSDEIKEPFIGVYRIKTPIEMASIGFSFEKVNTFVVMLARTSEENEALKLLGKISIGLIENEEFIEKLEGANVEENLEIIRRIIYSKENE